MAISDYARFDGLGLADLVRRKDVTAGELLEEAIARTERLNPALNAVVWKDYDTARAAARTPSADGVFPGVPFLLKDMSLKAKGTVLRQGSRAIAPAPGRSDSHLMRRFRASGLIAFGRTNVPEFGLVPTTESRLYGVAHNPWNLGLSPGGSSGGSAAAVAAGIVPLAHANDGGGSIRIPASCCGLVGLKPTRGRVSRGPDQADGMDGYSIDLALSRSVRDTAAMLDVAAGNEIGDPYSAPPAPPSFLAASQQPLPPLRIAFTTTRFDGSQVHPDCIAAIRHAATLCQTLGHDVEEASPDFDIAGVSKAFADIWCSHLAAGIDELAEAIKHSPSPTMMEPLTLAYYEKGRRVSASRYLRAKEVLGRATRRIATFHQTHTLWLTPVLAEPPWPLGRFDPDATDIAATMAEFGRYVPFTPLQNITGQPAISLPLFRNAQGIPIGVQFVAPFGEETLLLQLATQLEKAQPWLADYKPL